MKRKTLIISILFCLFLSKALSVNNNTTPLTSSCIIEESCKDTIKTNDVKSSKPTKKTKKQKTSKKGVVKKKSSKRLNRFEPKYCKLTTKDLTYNYEIIVNSVETSFDILHDSNEDPNTKEFLIEIAMVESRLGYHTSIFKMGGTKGKGAWQIDEVAFKATKNLKRSPQLQIYLDRIKEKTGIDWIKDVQWEHCNYVYFGSIAAHLYLLVMKVEAEATLHARAKQWKVYYNTYLGKGRIQDYLKRVNEVQNSIEFAQESQKELEEELKTLELQKESIQTDSL